MLENHELRWKFIRDGAENGRAIVVERTSYVDISRTVHDHAGVPKGICVLVCPNPLLGAIFRVLDGRKGILLAEVAPGNVGIAEIIHPDTSWISKSSLLGLHPAVKALIPDFLSVRSIFHRGITAIAVASHKDVSVTIGNYTHWFVKMAASRMKSD